MFQKKEEGKIKMFKKILVIYSDKQTQTHLNTIREIREKLEKERSEFVNSRDLNENCFENIDLIITIGGDGTFIRAASFIKNQLILGINSDPQTSEGALTNFCEKDIHILNKVLKGEYKTIKRQRAKIKRNNILLSELVLNEVYIGSYSQFHVSRYIIKHKNQEEEHRSSGVLVVTGSGSTAWFKSAGGKPFDFSQEKLGFLVREPYQGNNLFDPKIVCGDIEKGEKIIFKSKRHEGGIISIDGNKVYDFNKSDYLEIQLSEFPLNVIIKN